MRPRTPMEAATELATELAQCRRRKVEGRWVVEMNDATMLRLDTFLLEFADAS